MNQVSSTAYSFTKDRCGWCLIEVQLESSGNPIPTKDFHLKSGHSWLDLVGVQLEWAGAGWTWLGLVGHPLHSSPPGWIPNGMAEPQWSPIRQVGECEVLVDGQNMSKGGSQK